MVDFQQFQDFSPMNEKFIEETVDALFNKFFSFQNNGQYIIPNPHSMFTEDTWVIQELYDIKSELNNTKSKLNNYRLNQWSEHTRKRNKAGSVIWFIDKTIEPEFITQAWCKFYEIVSRFPLVPQSAITNGSFTSVHLCEAPGAFVTSLNHWLKTHHPLIKWDWTATTLNPYYEGNSIERMITDDRFIIHTLEHWNFGPYNTGNIMEKENQEQIKKDCEGKDKVFLVTADGSVDCANDPGEQEQIVAQLHLYETITALNILSEGGSFLLKMFTVFEHSSVSLLYLLFLCFESIHMFKPATSKEGNSEVYMICLNFKTTFFSKIQIAFKTKIFEMSSKAMYCREDIPETFLKQVVECAEFFKNQQCKVIMDNIESFVNDFKDVNLQKIKDTVCERFIDVYDLKKLERENFEIVGRTKLSAYKNICSVTRSPLESYNERKIIGNLDPIRRLNNLLDELQNVVVHEKDYRFERDYRPIYKLRITFGKPYGRIQSSKFVTTRILKVLNQSFETMKIIKLSIDFPSDEFITEYLNRACFDVASTTILKFEHTKEENNYLLINEMYKTLKKIKEGDNLVLIGYSLFSQVNVGLLKLVARFFRQLSFQPDYKLGYVIILSCFLSQNNYSSKNDKQNFDQLLNAAETAKHRETIILSVFSMLDLYETIWIKNIVDVNLWNIKCFAQYVDDKNLQGNN